MKNAKHRRKEEEHQKKKIKKSSDVFASGVKIIKYNKTKNK